MDGLINNYLYQSEACMRYITLYLKRQWTAICVVLEAATTPTISLSKAVGFG